MCLNEQALLHHSPATNTDVAARFRVTSVAEFCVQVVPEATENPVPAAAKSAAAQAELAVMVVPEPAIVSTSLREPSAGPAWYTALLTYSAPSTDTVVVASRNLFARAVDEDVAAANLMVLPASMEAIQLRAGLEDAKMHIEAGKIQNA